MSHNARQVVVTSSHEERAFPAPLAPKELDGYMIQTMRTDAGLTLEQLAISLGITAQRLKSLEDGTCDFNPSLSFFFEVAWACGLKLEIRFKLRNEATPSEDAPYPATSSQNYQSPNVVKLRPPS